MIPFLELTSPSISKTRSPLTRPLLALSDSSTVHSVCRVEREGSLSTPSPSGAQFLYLLLKCFSSIRVLCP